MIRIVATLCFGMTLFCPVYCLAEADGPCSDHGQTEPRNCEAMAVGAIIAEPAGVAVSIDQFWPQWAGFVAPVDPFEARPSWWLPLSVQDRATTRPPSASTRQALLQIYLF